MNLGTDCLSCSVLSTLCSYRSNRSRSELQSPCPLAWTRNWITCAWRAARAMLDCNQRRLTFLISLHNMRWLRERDGTFLSKLDHPNVINSPLLQHNWIPVLLRGLEYQIVLLIVLSIKHKPLKDKKETVIGPRSLDTGQTLLASNIRELESRIWTDLVQRKKHKFWHVSQQDAN